MLITGDESITYSKKVYGFVCANEKVFCDFESKVFSLRLEHKLWGEISYKKLPNTNHQLFDAYRNFIKIFLDTEGLQYYSIIYTKPNFQELLNSGHLEKYIQNLRYSYHGRMIYFLCNHIAYVIYKAGIREDLTILGDESSLFNKEWGIIKEFLEPKYYCKENMIYATFGNSAVSSGIQLADILTGLIASKVNNKLNVNQTKLLQYIEQRGCKLGTDDPVTSSRWLNKKTNTWYFKPYSHK